VVCESRSAEPAAVRARSYTFIEPKGEQMKIKVYLAKGYKIINVSVFDSIKAISEKYSRWEYVL